MTGHEEVTQNVRKARKDKRGTTCADKRRQLGTCGICGSDDIVRRGTATCKVCGKSVSFVVHLSETRWVVTFKRDEYEALVIQPPCKHCSPFVPYGHYASRPKESEYTVEEYKECATCGATTAAACPACRTETGHYRGSTWTSTDGSQVRCKWCGYRK